MGKRSKEELIAAIDEEIQKKKATIVKAENRIKELEEKRVRVLSSKAHSSEVKGLIEKAAAAGLSIDEIAKRLGFEATTEPEDVPGDTEAENTTDDTGSEDTPDDTVTE